MTGIEIGDCVPLQKEKMRFQLGRLMLVVWFLFVMMNAWGQETETAYQKGVAYQKELRFKEALDIFSTLLKNDSNNVDLLNRVAFLMAYPVYPDLTLDEKEKIYRKAGYFAARAVRLGPEVAYSHYHYALALGRLGEYSNLKSKIAHAKQIRYSCEKAISLDPTLPGPYHILARWHREVAGFNFIEKAMISTFYGTTLEGDYNEAIRNFKTALRLDPTNPVHSYEIAVTYNERGEKTDYHNARNWLHKTLQMKTRNDFDKQVKQKAQKLLKELGG